MGVWLDAGEPFVRDPRCKEVSVTRALILGASLLALAACSTHDNLLAPDPEAHRLISPEPRTNEAREVDPVCGTLLDDRQYQWHASYDGVEYAFHSEACRKQFEENPELYTVTVR